MNLFQFPQTEVLAYLIIFVRITAMISWFPIFGDNNTPVTVKILFSFLITLIIFPLVKKTIPEPISSELVSIIIIVVQETTIGLLMGLVSPKCTGNTFILCHEYTSPVF